MATSLCEGESIQKHVGILNIRPDNKVSVSVLFGLSKLIPIPFAFQVQNGRYSSALSEASNLQDNLRD